MTQAKGYFEVFRGNGPQTTLAHFCEAFGPYRWVRLIGLPEIIGSLNLLGSWPTVHALQSMVRDALNAAAESIALEGKMLFPQGNWGSCNVAQLRKALAGQLMSIEKAIIVARSTELACQRASREYGVPDFDVYKHLSIHACNCVLDGLDEWKACRKWPRRFFAGELNFVDELESRLRPRIKQLRLKRIETESAPKIDRTKGFNESHDVDRFILAVMDSEAITWKNAQLLKAAFDVRLDFKPSVRELPSRLSEAGLLRCNELEAPFVGLTLDELIALRRDLKLPLSA